MNYSARFLHADAITANLEGGRANNAADRGGETAYGISRGTYHDEEPWPPSRERAEYLRHRDFWESCNCDELPELVAVAVYDWAIHSGEGAPAKALQLELGIRADGDIGPQTVSACRSRCATPEDELALSDALMRARARRFAEIVRADATQVVFLAGWIVRLLEIANEIRGAYLVELDSRPIEPLMKGGEMTMGTVAGGEGAPREASGPVAGAVRQIVRYPVALVIGWVASHMPILVSPDSAPGMIDTVTLSVAGAALAALASLGKIARDKGWPLIGSLF